MEGLDLVVVAAQREDGREAIGPLPDHVRVVHLLALPGGKAERARAQEHATIRWRCVHPARASGRVAGDHERRGQPGRRVDDRRSRDLQATEQVVRLAGARGISPVAILHERRHPERRAARTDGPMEQIDPERGRRRAVLLVEICRVVDVSHPSRDVAADQVVGEAPEVRIGPHPDVEVLQHVHALVEEPVAEEHGPGGGTQRWQLRVREGRELHFHAEWQRPPQPIRVIRGIGVVEHAPQHLVPKDAECSIRENVHGGGAVRHGSRVVVQQRGVSFGRARVRAFQFVDLVFGAVRIVRDATDHRSRPELVRVLGDRRAQLPADHRPEPRAGGEHRGLARPLRILEPGAGRHLVIGDRAGVRDDHRDLIDVDALGVVDDQRAPDRGAATCFGSAGGTCSGCGDDSGHEGQGEKRWDRAGGHAPAPLRR